MIAICGITLQKSSLDYKKDRKKYYKKKVPGKFKDLIQIFIVIVFVWISTISL